MALTILKHTTHIDFVGVRRYAYAFSTIVILLGLVAIFMNGGLRYGVDFAGGVMVQIQFSKPVADEEVKKAVADIDMPGLTVQQVGNDSLNYSSAFFRQQGRRDGKSAQRRERCAQSEHAG